MPAQRSRPELFLKKRVLDACYRSWESLNVFLDKLLRRAARRYYQKQARRMRREVLLSHSELARLMTARSVPVIEPDWLQQLVECLTPAEKRYFDWALSAREGAPPWPPSPSYGRLLKHRILKKARRLLLGD